VSILEVLHVVTVHRLSPPSALGEVRQSRCCLDWIDKGCAVGGWNSVIRCQRRHDEPHDAAASPAGFGKNRFCNSSTSASDFAISVSFGLTIVR
jgi:hypothetical protein